MTEVGHFLEPREAGAAQRTTLSNTTNAQKATGHQGCFQDAVSSKYQEKPELVPPSATPPLPRAWKHQVLQTAAQEVSLGAREPEAEL